MSEVLMPQMGESIVEGTVTKWLKQIGDKVERDEPLFEITTDKVDSEVPSPEAGVLEEILVQEGETVEINTVVAKIGGGDGASSKNGSKAEKAEEKAEAKTQKKAETRDEPKEQEEAAAAPAPAAAATNGASADRIRSSPLVKRLAREHGIPFYVAAPWSTIDLATADGAAIPIEERSSREVTHVGATQVAPEGAKVRNPSFDVTPARFITGIITERGVYAAPFEATLAAAARETAGVR